MKGTQRHSKSARRGSSTRATRKTTSSRKGSANRTARRSHRVRKTKKHSKRGRGRSGRRSRSHRKNMQSGGGLFSELGSALNRGVGAAARTFQHTGNLTETGTVGIITAADPRAGRVKVTE